MARLDEGPAVPLYPLFLKLRDQPALVVGGGPIGAHKAGELLACGASVVALSLTFDESWDAHRVAEEEGRLRRLCRAFAAGDTRDMRLVVAATGRPDVDEQIAADARAHRALVNAVDLIHACDFYAGSVVRRGPVVVAIGTGGASPALARKVRGLIEAALPEGVGPLAEALGRLRPQLLSRYPSLPARAERLDRFVGRALERLAQAPSTDEVETWVRAELLSPAEERGGPPPPAG